MKTILSLILLISAFNLSRGATSIPGGEVSGLWLKSDSPYLITADVTIPADSLLIIEPGVQVTFTGHYALYVQGRLLAVGTQDDSIRFSVDDTTGFSDPDTIAGGWNGIRFIETPANNDSSLLVYCRLQYGKAIGNVWHINTGGALCVIDFDKLRVAHCFFRDNIAGGLMESPSGGAIHLAWSDIRLSANTFADNFAVAGGGAIQMHESNPVFERNIFQNNRAQTGGAVQIAGISLPVFTNDRILNNQAVTHGGGIQIYEPSVLTCTGVVFEGNTAQWGGGIGAAGAEVQATACTFSANKVELWGGGVAGDFADLYLTDCLFSADSSGWGSGGLHTDHATAIIHSCIFNKNMAVFGGGSHSLFSTITFNQCTFTENTANDAAGIHIENSSVSIDSCRFEKNTVQNANAAFQFRADSLPGDKPYDLKISHTVFKENSSPGLVAGVAIDQTDTLKSLINVQIENCDFIDNQAYRVSGLRLYGKSEDFLVSNCIFSGNIATTQNAAAQFVNNCTGRVENCLFSSNQGGACLTINQHPVVNIFNCTFAGNTQAVVGGLSLRRGAKVFLTNSIIWSNTGDQVRLTTAAGAGCELTVNYCSIEDGIDSVQVSDSLCSLNWGEGNIDVYPQFVDSALADFHLQDTSPCIGSGVNCLLLADSWSCAPTYDLDGSPRPNPPGSVSDIGAYENILSLPTSLGKNLPVTAGRFQLLQNYPNPFNPLTTIRFTLPRPAFVTLKIYTVLGTEVARVVSDKLPAGAHSFPFDARRLASGIYYYQLIAAGYKDVKKMIVLK